MRNLVANGLANPESAERSDRILTFSWEMRNDVYFRTQPTDPTVASRQRSSLFPDA